MTEQPTTEQPYTEADVERLGQAMADANTPDAWIHPQIVPMAHFARVVLDALAAAGRLLPEGASREPAQRRDELKAALHPALHDLDVRIVGLGGEGHHCNLVAEVALDAIMPVVERMVPPVPINEESADD